VGSGHITTATVVKAAWAYVLAQASASGDVVFGHTISGRNAAVEGVENMIGPCVNLVPVRVRFGERGWTARDLLRYVQDQQVANMPHEVLGFRDIVRHCTAWPDWTYFTSTVQHQNIDQSARVRLGDIDYRLGWASAAAQEDFCDLSVFSQLAASDGDETTASGDNYEILLSFTEGGAIPREFAEKALAMLCDAARLFSTEPDAALLSPEELAQKPKLVPFEDVSPAALEAGTDNDDNFRDAMECLQRLDRAEVRALSEMVTAAWRQVLLLPGHRQRGGEDDDEDDTHSVAVTTRPMSVGSFHPDTSFFSLGGDIIGLAQLSWLLDQRGVPVPRLEDLINHPTLRGHMAVLAASAAAAPTLSPWALDASEAEDSAAASAESEAETQDRYKGRKVHRPLRKAVHLAKKLAKR
jgi:non-ribosomal peptide synthetase component F